MTTTLTRHTTTLILTLTALAILLTLAIHTGYLSIYHAQNTGITIGSYGYEFSGPDGPGFFHCDGQC